MSSRRTVVFNTHSGPQPASRNMASRFFNAKMCIRDRRWLGATFYPQIYKDSPEKQVKDFFKLFYSIEVDDAQLAEILAGTFE